MENPNIVYGQITAYFDIAGFSFEKAIPKLEYLLKEKRWMKIGEGYNDCNDFLRSLTIYWSQYRINIEQRKELISLIKENEPTVSQRAIADMVGVDNATIHHDLKNVENSTIQENISIENELLINNDVENSTPSISSGEQLVEKQHKEEQKQQKKEEKIREAEKKKEQAAIIDSIAVNPTRDIKRGDIIKLGNHILYCEDAYNLDIKADALITDPPYGINYEPDWKKWNGTASDFKKITGDIKAFDPMPFMKYKTMLFFGANYYTGNLPTGGWFVWDKRTDELKDKMIGNPFELAWFISQHTNKKAIIKRILHGGVINADSKKGNNEKRFHPTQKPIILLQSIIEEITIENETIIDPFAGSGSTLLACELSNRNCRAIEIEPEYCSIIISRWEEATNKKAIWMQE